MDRNTREISCEKRFYQASVLLAFLCTLLLWHPDCRSVVCWGYDLLTSLFTGKLFDFPVYTYEAHGLATNYTLFVNLITALWLLPVYLAEKICGTIFATEVYEIWYKILLFATSWICGWLFDQRMREWLPNQGDAAEAAEIKDRYFARGLFFSSGILFISVLGKGQVDIFSLLFLHGFPPLFLII